MTETSAHRDRYVFPNGRPGHHDEEKLAQQLLDELFGDYVTCPALREAGPDQTPSRVCELAGISLLSITDGPGTGETRKDRRCPIPTPCPHCKVPRHWVRKMMRDYQRAEFVPGKDRGSENDNQQMIDESMPIMNGKHLQDASEVRTTLRLNEEPPTLFELEGDPHTKKKDDEFTQFVARVVRLLSRWYH